MIAATTVDVAQVLFDLFIVLVVAKLAAEVAERLRIPAVIGEIVAGVLIGPSVVGLVESSEIIVVLAELGVVLLLLQVGLETDPAELGRVGRAALAVGVIGVVAPFVLGTLVGVGLGQDTQTAIFVGAALTATSVGITARVFGDLRALATIEARMVLGAAVADDVLGLIILTVVTKVVVDGSVDAVSVGGTIALALAFLVVTAALGLRLVPPAFDVVERTARSSATLIALAIALAFGFAAAAGEAHLAPIIGAFVAGLALGRTRQHDRVERDVSALATVFVPIFFVHIGIETDLSALADPKVLGLSLALLVVAVIGKLVSAVGARGTPADRWTVGLAMIPRGEVGLIFASIGAQTGVLDDELYGAVVLVVLATTLITPPLLRARLEQIEEPAAGSEAAVAEPSTGWLVVADGELGIEAGTPPEAALRVALRTATSLGEARPSAELVDWFGAHHSGPLAWEPTDTELLLGLLQRDDPRAWHFLALTGTLERALPELSDALHRRRNDLGELDPVKAMRFASVDTLHELAEAETPAAQAGRTDLTDRTLLLAALAHDVAASPEGLRRFAGRLTDPVEADEIAATAEGSTLLTAAARDPDSFEPSRLGQLAAHLATPERARRAHRLATARLLDGSPVWQREALDELFEQLRDVYEHPEADGGRASSLALARRRTAMELAEDDAVRERIAFAPDDYVLGHEPQELARQARLIEPSPGPRSVRVQVTRHPDQQRWIVDVAARDRAGLLARVSGVLSEAGYPIEAADAVTWPDGAVLETFVVRSPMRPGPQALSEAIERGLHGRLPRTAAPLQLTVTFDGSSLPRHTSCVVEGPDGLGLLQALTSRFSRAGVRVDQARVRTADGRATLRFALTDRHGRKLAAAQIERLQAELAPGGDRTSTEPTRHTPETHGQ